MWGDHADESTYPKHDKEAGEETQTTRALCVAEERAA